MKIETLYDVLEWTRQLHQQLSNQLHDVSARSNDERARLLLDYLSAHELQLSNLLLKFEEEADSRALRSWCYEFFSNNSQLNQLADLHIEDASADQIMSAVTAIHQQVIELYRQLNDQFESPAASTIIQEMLKLEEHEAMRMTHGSNRLEDV